MRGQTTLPPGDRDHRTRFAPGCAPDGGGQLADRLLERDVQVSVLAGPSTSRRGASHGLAVGEMRRGASRCAHLWSRPTSSAPSPGGGALRWWSPRPRPRLSAASACARSRGIITRWTPLVAVNEAAPPCPQERDGPTIVHITNGCASATSRAAGERERARAEWTRQQERGVGSVATQTVKARRFRPPPPACSRRSRVRLVLWATVRCAAIRCPGALAGPRRAVVRRAAGECARAAGLRLAVCARHRGHVQRDLGVHGHRPAVVATAVGGTWRCSGGVTGRGFQPRDRPRWATRSGVLPRRRGGAPRPGSAAPHARSPPLEAWCRATRAVHAAVARHRRSAENQTGDPVDARARSEMPETVDNTPAPHEYTGGWGTRRGGRQLRGSDSTVCATRRCGRWRESNGLYSRGALVAAQARSRDASPAHRVEQLTHDIAPTRRPSVLPRRDEPSAAWCPSTATTGRTRSSSPAAWSAASTCTSWSSRRPTDGGRRSASGPRSTCRSSPRRTSSSASARPSSTSTPTA